MESDPGQKLYWDDATWILTSSFIIFTMQSGFALLESGCVTRKNEANIMLKNAVDVVFGGLGYWMFGYGLSFGRDASSNSVIAFGKFFIDAKEDDIGSVFSTYFFQLSFSTTATTIVSGAMAERTNFSAYCIFSFCNTLTYCLPAGWIWGDLGFLKRMQVVDLAGCAPVHLVGGASALVAAIFLKPRLGRYESGRAPAMGSPTNALVGMFMLWWGWLGFNCGSIFGVSGDKWKYAARSAIVTLNASVGGGVLALTYSYVFCRRVDVLILINGILASLVAITAGCALYEPWEAMVVGAVGALVALVAMSLLDRLRIDDPVGCVAVHFFGAIWGMLAVSLFVGEDTLLHLSRGQRGLLRGGDMRFLAVQALGIACVAAWSVVTTFILLYVINRIIPLRMSPEHEMLGADYVEHGIRYGKEDGGLPLLKFDANSEIPVSTVRNPNIAGRRSRIHPYQREDEIFKYILRSMKRFGGLQTAWSQPARTSKVKTSEYSTTRRSNNPWYRLFDAIRTALDRISASR